MLRRVVCQIARRVLLETSEGSKIDWARRNASASSPFADAPAPFVWDAMSEERGKRRKRRRNEAMIVREA